MLENSKNTLSELLSKSASELIAMGGDTRIIIDELSGLNGYGCSPYPSYSIAYSSCTGSTISTSAYAFIEAYLHELRKKYSNQTDPKIFEEEFEFIREKIAQFHELPSDVEMVLGSSGTDLELVMLAVSMAEGNAVHNIVLGANEVGSGIEYVAKGRYFSTLTPHGKIPKLDQPIEGFDSNALSYVNIDIRNADGGVRSEEEVVADFEREIEWAIENNKKALVHSIHRTKTGLIVLSPSALEGLLKKYGSAIDVLVDACQGRISIRLVNAYINAGAAVLLTGSKFYSGPPFSGALILPPAMREKLKQRNTIPAGLNEFFTRYEFPSSWSFLNGQLNEEINLGLLLRWQAAVYEMNRVFLIPNKRIETVINTFTSTARQMIASSGFLREESLASLSDEDVHPTQTISPFELNSIITFTINDDEKFRQLNLDDAKLIHRALYTDLSHIIPDSHKLASTIIQLGQPVKVKLQCNGQWNASLRIALSSVHIGELGLLDDRFIQLRFTADMDTLKQKLILIIDHLDSLRKI
jgi:hypothetical protein